MYFVVAISPEANILTEQPRPVLPLCRGKFDSPLDAGTDSLLCCASLFPT